MLQNMDEFDRDAWKKTNGRIFQIIFQQKYINSKVFWINLELVYFVDDRVIGFL